MCLAAGTQSSGGRSLTCAFHLVVGVLLQRVCERVGSCMSWWQVCGSSAHFSSGSDYSISLMAGVLPVWVAASLGGSRAGALVDWWECCPSGRACAAEERAQSSRLRRQALCAASCIEPPAPVWLEPCHMQTETYRLLT